MKLVQRPAFNDVSGRQAMNYQEEVFPKHVGVQHRLTAQLFTHALRWHAAIDDSNRMVR